ncbi:hypothetical protein BDZ97DRAFT_2071160 [Flammula alnicola]|nr:hypothetical protein BDZ97DRAFT_2071160 [Flammula alnicola]
MDLSNELQSRAPKAKDPAGTCYIASLPDDILFEIFSTFLPDAMNELDTPFQKTLVAICRSWRNMVMGAPLLWTKIGVPSTSSQDTLLYFERSKPALIDVKFDTIWNRPKPERLRLIRDTLAKHLSRLRSLTVNGFAAGDVEAIFSRWKDRETPDLKTLDISSIQTIPGSRVPSWKDIDVRALQSLKLQGLDIQDFPHSPSLTFLDIKTMKLSPTNFQTLFEKFPLLNTLVIQNSPSDVSPPLPQEDHINLSKLNAPSLRSLAIDLGRDHTEDCGCMLPFLSVVMKDLEYLEVADFSSDLTPHLTSIFAQWVNLPRLQKLRIRISSPDVWMDDISFLSSLPKSTDLEIAHLPKEAAHAALVYVLGLTNLHSITFNLAPASYEETFYGNHRSRLDLDEFSSIVRRQKPKFGCPIILRLPGDKAVHPGLREIGGDSLTITTTPSAQSFLEASEYMAFYSDDDESMGNSNDGDPDYDSDFLEFIEREYEDYGYEVSEPNDSYDEEDEY